MANGNKQFGFGFIVIISLIFGVIYLVDSVAAFRHNKTVMFAGKGATIEISPRVALIISACFFVYGVIGLFVIWKNKNKFPPD